MDDESRSAAQQATREQSKATLATALQKHGMSEDDALGAVEGAEYDGYAVGDLITLKGNRAFAFDPSQVDSLARHVAAQDPRVQGRAAAAAQKRTRENNALAFR